MGGVVVMAMLGSMVEVLLDSCWSLFVLGSL